MKQLICFDLDNTLIDSDEAHFKAFEKALKEYNLRVNKKKMLKLFYGLSSELILKKLFPNLTVDEIDAIRRRHDEFVVNETSILIRTIKNSPKLLKQLKKKYKIAIVSNCRYNELIALLKQAGITKQMYDIAIGKDDVKRPKPYPDELFKAEKLLKHKAVCIVGDSIFDVMAGKRAGIKTISVLTGHNTRKELDTVGADIIVKDVSCVAAAVTKYL